MNVNPYLHFNGHCQEALKFYEKVLGARLEFLMPFAGSPAEGQVPPELKEKILHARLSIHGHVVSASDAPPGYYSKPQGFSMSLGFTDAAEGERIFKALSENGHTVLPFAKTFWSIGFGMCVDRFGIPWMVNCE